MHTLWNFQRNWAKKVVSSSSSCPRLSLEGRRSQGGLTLNGLDFGLFRASKYKVNTFLSLKVTEIVGWIARSSKNRLAIWPFQWLCKIIGYFWGFLKNRKYWVSFLYNLYFFPDDLLVFWKLYFGVFYLLIDLLIHKRSVWVFSIFYSSSFRFFQPIFQNFKKVDQYL